MFPQARSNVAKQTRNSSFDQCSSPRSEASPGRALGGRLHGVGVGDGGHRGGLRRALVLQ